MAKAGRPESFTKREYLNAVMKINSMKDQDIADELGCTRWTILRFRKKDKNKETIEKAEEHIDHIAKLEFTKEFRNFEVFRRIPIVEEWEKAMLRRRVGKNKIENRLRRLFHMCCHINSHPARLNAKKVSEVIIKSRTLHYEGKKQPLGLAYSTQREAMRSFFMIVFNMSGQHLANLGIDMSALKDSGKYAKQKVSREVRRKFEKEIKEYCAEKDLSDEEYLELLNIAVFMYYTGTRISATLGFNFNESLFSLTKKMWMIEVLDKGQKGGIKWEKYLVGHALEQFKEYCSKRFNIPIEDLESELHKKTDHLFPSFINTKGNVISKDVRKIYKIILIRSGLQYKEFPPTHIWRHTFAQDFLRASDWNYEACASLGGWKSTLILKKHYGEMGMQPKLRVLNKSMGIPVEDVTYELRW